MNQQHMQSDQELALLEKQVHESLGAQAPTFSPLEYFNLILPRALGAVARGDYGVAAALVHRHDGTETVSLASNRLFSNDDPLGHAETMSIKAMLQVRGKIATPHTMAALHRLPTEDVVFTRDLPAPVKDGLLLFTTLEPCPMCLIALLNAGVSTIVVGAPDPMGGGVHAQESILAGVWRDIARARNLQVHYAGPGAPYDIPAEVIGMCRELFELSRNGLDGKLSAGLWDR